MFNTIVHQTLKNNRRSTVEQNGPFISKLNTYLGKGYYFWDDHIELAKWWGEVHCKNDYIICEGNFIISRNSFLDLVGSRQDMKHLALLMKKFDISHFNIGEAIEFFKKIEKLSTKKGIFPFNAIRAIDFRESSFIARNVKFAKNKTGVMTFSPQIIICLIEKNKLILPTYKIINP